MYSAEIDLPIVGNPFVLLPTCKLHVPYTQISNGWPKLYPASPLDSLVSLFVDHSLLQTRKIEGLNWEFRIASGVRVSVCVPVMAPTILERALLTTS